MKTSWPGPSPATASSSVSRRAIPTSGSRLATAAPRSPPPAPTIDNKEITGHAIRSHPHPSPSQTGSRAASSPPRAGRNFLNSLNRGFVGGFAGSEYRHRAERVANRAGRDVENPWNLIGICSRSLVLGQIRLLRVLADAPVKITGTEVL